MDHQRDFANFRRLMARLCETMDKPLTDELVESWWKALRQVQFADVERRMEAFLARATESTRFPRPSSFRPDDAPVYDQKEEAREKRIHEENAKNWRAFIVEHPITGPLRLKMAIAARIMASEREDSPAYAEAQSEYHRAERQLGEHGRFSADR